MIIHCMRRFNVLEFLKGIGDLVKKSESYNRLNFYLRERDFRTG